MYKHEAFDSMKLVNRSTTDRCLGMSRGTMYLKASWFLVDIRDDWNNKAGLDQQLSHILTALSTVNVSSTQLYLYATDGCAKGALGSCIAFKPLIWRLPLHRMATPQR
ncbi:hypothetical protein GGR53DRAFT_496591 [Hypoxylon sp. FL1150]|nr:hypothetical protein GGR53DRAFT_496591 [Hypoxylon sp. FL1150]